MAAAAANVLPIQSVTGKLKPEKLGKTLMHEHVMVGYPGWDADWVRPGRSKREMRKIAADKIAEMKREYDESPRPSNTQFGWVWRSRGQRA